MPYPLDVLLVLLFAVLWPLAEYFWTWPRHLRAVAAGDPHARSRWYSRTVIEEWALTGAVIALSLGFARPLSTLALGMPQGWRLWLGVGVPAVYMALVILQGRALSARPATLARLRRRLEALHPLIPHTPGEFRLFVALSFTAGICEELLYRGYLVWVLRSWIGLAGAAGVSMVMFGFAHAYQGRSYGIRAFFTGVAFGLLALATGSILPGMALHALIDLGSGWISYMAVRGGGESPEVPVGAGVTGLAEREGFEPSRPKRA